MVETSLTQAIMLLTVSFGRSDGAESKPLSIKEWARFAVWLRAHGSTPADLLKSNLGSLLEGWVDRSITASRLESLMAHGATLGLALEKWQRAGLWVMTRSDPDYPERLKQRLRWESPPVLFGCGERKLLQSRGIAVVGSRDATSDDLRFAGHLGEQAAAQGYVLVSGGARGVDQSAMTGALENEGTAVGVLADNLLRSAISSRYRPHLLAGHLALVSPSNPESGFDVGRAMSRNRYIYCLADSAVVVSSTARKGGTWNGAIEAIKAKWVPVWVKQHSDATSGNADLIHQGAACLAEHLDNMEVLFDGPRRTFKETTAPMPLLAAGEPPAEISTAPASPNSTYLELMVAMDRQVTETYDGRSDLENEQPRPGSSFYDLFLIWLADLTADTPLLVDDIAERLDVNKRQVETWLKRGQMEDAVVKLKKPVRYQIKSGSLTQASLPIDSDR